MIKSLLAISFLFVTQLFFAQGEGNNWYFGNGAGIDFNTSPPTAVTGSLSQLEGCSSISDAQGNLLMYTDGMTVYTRTHSVMANGTGLGGHQSSSQSAVIVKQPGNTNLYYIFTTNDSGAMCYYVVDMSLAGGMGSVTASAFLIGNSLERQTAALHSNGYDIWILGHENNTSANYFAFLLTSAGVNTTAVLSALNGTGNQQYVGYIKVSPDGKRVGSAYFGYPFHGVELCDFNASTGQLSNPRFFTVPVPYGMYGIEFSPDVTKLYASSQLSIHQWDLCAGTTTAIAATQYTTPTMGAGALQLGPDGKIYLAHYLQGSLGVINNPNAQGSNCNFLDNSFSLFPNLSAIGLPNYISNLPKPSQFTITVGSSSNTIGCMSASFTCPSISNLGLFGCVPVSSTITSVLWNFGDPNSGATNTSTLQVPLHMFSSLGTYTISLNVSLSNSTSVSLQQTVNINYSCISVVSNSITCANLGSATVTPLGGQGPFSYTWTPSGQTGSVATNLQPGTYSIAVYDQSSMFTYTAQTVFSPLVPLTAVSAFQPSIECYGANTATGTIGQFAGGSGGEYFHWTNGTTSYTNQFVATLSAGVWTLTATDTLTACKVVEIFYITQPSSITINIAPSSFTACQGTNITFTASAWGGTGSYSYTWAGSPPSETLTINQASGGTYIYTVGATDSFSCQNSNTISVNYYINPVFTVTNASICPLQTGTLTVAGATGYTWTVGGTGSTFAANPSVTSVYNFTGSALGCTNTGSGTIFLKPLPQPMVSSNSPRCNGQNLQFFAGGGASYVWDGPQLYSAFLQSPVRNLVNLSHSGVYNVTVTGANSCTAAISHTVVIHPTPTVSAVGDTICMQSPLNLFSNSIPGAIFNWSGPQGFGSSQQNPVITNAQVGMTGYYTVKATSVPGCTNVAVVHASVVAKPVPVFTTNSPRCVGENLVINASSTSGGTNFQWTGPNGFVSTSITNTIINVSIPEGGIYSLNVTTGPCVVSTQQQVIVNPLPVVQLSSNSPVCDGKTLNLDANAPGFNIVGYVWQGPSGFFSITKSPVLNNVTSSAEGSYYVQVKDINSCNSSASIPVNILANPTLATQSSTVCIYDSATITAIGAVAYTWHGPFLSVSQGSAGIIGSAGYFAPQNYLVVGMAANGCTAITTATVSTRNLPVPIITISPDARVCRNETITLSGSGALSYAWVGPKNISLGGQTVSLHMVSSSYAGEYTLIATDAFNCKGAVTTVIEVDELPQGSIVETYTNHCVPYCSEFRYMNPNPKAPVKVQWQVENKLISTKDFYHCFNRPGEYIVTGMFLDSTTSCKSSSTFNIPVHRQPSADFEWQPEKPVEGGDDVYFINKTFPDNDIRASWFYFDNANGEKRTINSSWIFKDAGTYPIAMIATSSEGCSDTIVKNIVIAPDFVIYIPNAFTPDGNGKNEVFMPVLRAVKFYDLKVYDRWGELIYAGTDPLTGWDGTYKGQICKMDNYAYKIILTTLSGENKMFSGSVLLLK